MDILDIFGHFYLNHLSPLWGYFSFQVLEKKISTGHAEDNFKVRFSPYEIILTRGDI